METDNNIDHSINRSNSNDYMSQTVRYNGIVTTSGQVADDYSATLEEQTLQALENVKKELLAAGSSPEKLLTTTVYMNDIRGFETMNKVWKAWFGGQNMPTRATIESRLAVPGMLIEIVATAAE